MAELTAGQHEALDRLRAALRQGDVLHADAFAVVGAPEATLLEDTRDAEEFARYRLTAVERRLTTGLWAVITQSCDIRRDVDVEPFLQLSPLLDLPEAEWVAARDGLASTRRFAYPHSDSSTPSARFDWGGAETRVNVTFTAKSEAKSTATLEHSRLPDADEAEQMKAWWRERLTALASRLEGGEVDA